MNWKICARRWAVVPCLVAALCVAPAVRANSTMSELSLLPVALSATVSAATVIAPSAILATAAASGVVLTVVAVQAVAAGSVWILERASDGARMSLQFSAGTMAVASLVVGTAVTVSVVSTGWVLSAAGHAIAFIPNELGRALTYHERLGR